MSEEKQALNLVEKYLDKVNEVVKEYGPEAAELGLTVFQIKAIQEIVLGGLLFFLGVGLLYLCYKLVIKAIKCDPLHDEEVVYILGSASSAISGVSSLITGTAKLLNLTAWVGMFYPGVYMLSEFIDKL